MLAWAETKWGPQGMLTTESVMGVIGILLFGIALVLVRRFSVPAPAPA